LRPPRQSRLAPPSAAATASGNASFPATGIPEVDRAIAAGLDASGEGLGLLLRYLTTPCTTADGLGGPPKCAAGEAEGTPVEVFPMGGPESSFARAGETPAFLPLEVTGLYGVYRVARPGVTEEYFPAGDWGVVFNRPNGLLLDARVTSEGIVRIDYPPPGMGSEWWDVAAEEWLVQPRDQ
jgi:hypothetical protein